MPRRTPGVRRVLALAAMTMLATGAAGAVAPAAEASAQHHPLCALTSEQIGPPTSDDPCVASEAPDLEEGGDPFGQPWPGPCHFGFREEVLYNPAGFAYGVCVPL